MLQRRDKATSSRIIQVLAVSLMSLGLAASAHAAYGPGYAWDRSDDWNRAIAAVASGAPTLSPGIDSEGNEAWQYESVQGDGIGGANLWYENTGPLMSPDNAWFGTPGALVWSFGDDKLPAVDAFTLYHMANNTWQGLHGVWENMPMVRWLNPTGQVIELDITGTLRVVWANTDELSLPVDVAIARVNLTTGDATPLYTLTLANTVTGSALLEIDVPAVAMASDDSLAITVRASRLAPRGTYIALHDDLLLVQDVSQIPEPGTLALLAMGGVAALRRRRRKR